jgi:predicted regulator of Ras-like GTPase activity (Roadblock/LC7/MglB family)|tara:strand:+ start:50 stop:406 length:357 start_codon:yes stop_codon:yes gene_type:complete
MLNPKALPEVLGEVLTSGVRTAALVNRSGMLLGCAGDTADATLAGAIGANLWQCHERSEGAGALECMLMECDDGRVAIKAVGSYIIICCTDASVPFGQLKAKTLALHDFLQGPLSQLS